MATDDAFQPLDALLAARQLTSPWLPGTSGANVYGPDYELLAQLLAVPIGASHAQATGRVAKSIDAWCAHELRRSGFLPDEVWPRATVPRVLPTDITALLAKLPKKLRGEVLARVLKNKTVAPAEARVLGRVFLKQADVLVAQWSRGAEVLISTKSMLSSYGNNLRNRFEESYGDAKNLRGRFPLVSLGFLYLLRSDVTESKADWELALDMLRKLREDVDGYDATALILAEWDDGTAFAGVTIDNASVPADLRADQLLTTIIARTLERTPVSFHVRVRELRDDVDLGLEEGEQPGAESADGE